ncbi:hypothetical protein SRABI96_02104 [Peribacillus sp. Bi96]|uniref:hypothetical protein n=1 Tax=unclassified Peribacillus TaxID=2675266 RepID=UPI001D6045C3|nr:hypothetical protein [Peribacillus sp. Bi96]CAH0208288.1 hypothetical protein SRABI96_02104 [Peribacillus sp. Bi96]
MASKRKFDDFLFGRNDEIDGIQYKSHYFNEHVPKLDNGQRNKQSLRGKKVGPSHLPPVPVVLDPSPIQITPIGTIPIYYRRT